MSEGLLRHTTNVSELDDDKGGRHGGGILLTIMARDDGLASSALSVAYP